MVPKIHSPLKKEGCPLETTKHIFLSKIRLNWPESMHIYLAKYTIFLRYGPLPPCNPRLGASPLYPHELSLAHAGTVCSFHSQLLELPHVENLD